MSETGDSAEGAGGPDVARLRLAVDNPRPVAGAGSEGAPTGPQEPGGATDAGSEAAAPAARRGSRKGAPPKAAPTGRADVIARLSAERQSGEIFPGSPVRALGVHGDVFFYLDALGQLRQVTTHSKTEIEALFTPQAHLLDDWFPQFTKTGGVSGFSQDVARRYLMRACGERGVWAAHERVRGLGAWPDEDGGVVLHCGDAVWWRGAWHRPGDLGGYVYPSGVRLPRPLDRDEPMAVEDLLDILESWRWVRGDLDALLLLGWMVSAIFGGALPWRPLLWITGDAGTGKSTAQDLIRGVLGGTGAMLRGTDVTEAGVRQYLMQSTVPVLLDEAEPDADERRSRIGDVVKLARQAASGGVVLRGGQDHQGREFKARSSFLFSSILVPPLLDQDISRLALLELLPMEPGAVAPKLEERRLVHVGRVIRRRVLAQWPRLHETRELYRAQLARQGHGPRGCDQYGTLLCMADLVLYDAVPGAARVAGWTEKLDAAAIGEQTDQTADWRRCLNHLFGQSPDLWRSGDRPTVGRLVLAAAGLSEEVSAETAGRALASVGLRVIGRTDTASLVVANAHPQLERLFHGTHWRGGGWRQGVRRVPGARACPKPQRFDLVLSRAWQFALSAVPGLIDEEGGG